MKRDAEPKLLSAKEDLIKVDHRSITIAAGGTLPIVTRPLAGHLLSTFPDGAALRSGANEHKAQLRVELWSAAPAPDTSRAWEGCEEGRFVSSAASIYVGGPLTIASSEAVKLPAAGTLGIRVYCEGRKAAHDFEEAWYESEEGDDTYLDLPPGLEKWLVQLWPDEAVSGHES